jgi:hypothetical protein
MAMNLFLMSRVTFSKEIELIDREVLIGIKKRSSTSVRRSAQLAVNNDSLGVVMSTRLDELAKILLSVSRKRLLRKSPVFKPHRKIFADSLDTLERKIGIPIPDDLRDWLLAIGYGDINEEISFREEWFAAIESGQLKGGAIFAQDVLGNFYAFDSLGRIYYFCRSQPLFAIMSESFLGFIEEIARRDYKLMNWSDSLETQPYEW